MTEEDVRRQALVVFSDGEDTSSLVSFDEVLDLAKRSETSIYAIAPARRRHADARVSRGGVRACGRWRRKPAAARSSRPSIDDLNGVYAQIADELASQYTLGYTSKNPRRDGAWRRIVVQRDAAERDAAHQAGLLTPRPAGEPAPPRPLRRRRRRLRDPLRAPRARVPAAPPRRSCCCGALAHTFVIGMQTMEVRHVPFANPSRAVSTFVWLLTLSYLYLELTTDERAMGVFILPIIVGLQLIPGALPGRREPRPGARQPVVLGARLVAAVRLRQLRAGRRARPDLHAAVQGDQEEAPRLLLHAAAVAADPRCA